MNIRMFSLAHYTKVLNIRRFSLSHYKKLMNIRRCSLFLILKSNEYSKVFVSPLPKSGEYSKVFAVLTKSDEYSKFFSLSSGLLGPFVLHQARARGSSCWLLRLSGLAQAGTPMRMLAGARAAFKKW